MSANRLPQLLLLPLLLLLVDGDWFSTCVVNATSSSSSASSDPHPPLVTLLPSQIWNSFSLFEGDSELDGAIMQGLHGVGIFLLGWFCIMSVIGIGMRCYLCCTKLRSGDRDLRSLYDSFADVEADAQANAYDDEEGENSLEMS